MIGANKRLIDPACGSGSFLVTAAKRLVEAYKATAGGPYDAKEIIKRVQQNLFGFDLNPFACYLAEMNLLIQILDLVKEVNESGHTIHLDRFNIYNVDALARPSGGSYYMSISMLQAEENEQANNIKSRATNTPYAQGFGFVVANPPYGASLSDTYKKILRDNWSDVFYGQPDTYTFFLKLGIDLLANNGRLGYITPNTYLMGTNSAALRHKILTATRIEQIVDLPQGIWDDANVDCVLLFLAAEKDELKRRAQQIKIYMLDLRASLDKLRNRQWSEMLIQPQSRWLADAQYKMNIRYDALLQYVEDVCRIPIEPNSTVMKVQRLGEITESTQGIIPYLTSDDGQANSHIRPAKSIPPGETNWKPLLDSSAFIGRYELRWGKEHPYLKYGTWLARGREQKYFDSPKLIVQGMRNRALKRRLVATYDDQQFYNRHNFNNIIAQDPDYDLKYILALFNSSLLNYWYSRTFANVNANPSYFRQLPIYPADTTTQADFVKLVDRLLTMHADLNRLREQGYIVRYKRNGEAHIEVPYDELLAESLRADASYPVLTLFDAKSLGLFSIPERCDLQATISSNVYILERSPTTLVLRHNKLWFEVPDDKVRRYLLGYFKRPQWQGKTWNDCKNAALLPDESALDAFFHAEAQKKATITQLLNEIERIDTEIDERVLDLYGIVDAADRQRVLGSAPRDEDEEDIAPSP